MFIHCQQFHRLEFPTPLRAAVFVSHALKLIWERDREVGGLGVANACVVYILIAEDFM